jgi:SOS-response transcriptional repressor LexA
MSPSKIRPTYNAIVVSNSEEFLETMHWCKIDRPENARPEDRFARTLVVGDSLVGDEIYDGDYIISRLNFDASELAPGRLVLVDTPVGLRVRHYYKLNRKIKLRASNDAYPDLVLDQDQVEIRGIVVRHVPN